MSNIKISEMAEAESLNDNDLLTIVQSGVNKKITKQNAIGDIIQAINNPTYTTTEGTDLSINNTRVGKMKFEYYGDTEQQTYTGVNKIGTLTDFVANDTSAINITYNTEANTITVKHLTTAAWKGIYKTLTGLTAGATMTISVYATTTTSTGWSLSVRNSGGTVIDETIHNTSGTETHFTFTVPNDGSITIRAYAGYGDVAVNDTATYSKFQLEYGSSVTAYEPYVGGMPSPSPDYPQEVKTVTGENTIKITGRNRIKINDITWNGAGSNGLTYNLKDGVIRITGTAGSAGYSTYTLSSRVNFDELNKIPNGTKITFSVLDITGLGANQIFIGKTGQQYWMQPNATTKKATVTKDADLNYMAIWFQTTQGQVYDITIKPMLVTGEVAYNFEEYKSQTYEINLGKKNYFYKNNINLIDGYYVDGTGKVVAGSNNKFNWIKLHPNTTYTLNQLIVSNVTRRIALFEEQPAANSTGTLIGTFSGTKAIDITFNSNNYSYIGWMYCNTANLNGHTYEEMINSIILAEGNNTQFITNNPIKLCEIIDRKDHIYDTGGKWYKHKEIQYLNLDGVTYNGTYLFPNGMWVIKDAETNETLKDCVKENNLKIYCNYLTSKNTTKVMNDGEIGIVSNGSTGEVVVNFGITSSIADNMTWLSNHPTEVYYPLATPIEEEITEPTLINQLNAIKWGAESYYGETNIIITTENAQPTIEAKAYEKI